MFQPIILPFFKKKLKPHTKKHRDLKQAVITSLAHFDKRQHADLGGGIYKIRLHLKSLPKGKSKSFRLITLVLEVEQFLVPLTIYFKGDAENVSKKEINDCLENILLELQAVSKMERGVGH